MFTFKKDPDAKLDFKFDWSAWLTAGESIDNYSLELFSDEESPVVLKIDSDSNLGDSIIVWLSAGTHGVLYEARCEIETNQNRTDERTMLISCKDR